MSFGWKSKAERLRMVILSAAHQSAKELPPTFLRCLALFREVAKTGDMAALDAAWPSLSVDEKPLLWEPLEIRGWNIQALMYLDNGQLWWLVHAVRQDERSPSEKDLVFLDKILDYLGAVPARHVIIGPRSSLPGEELLPFGWWTWQNREQLYDIQVNKDKASDAEKIRIVPLGSRATDGYVSLHLKQRAELEELTARHAHEAAAESDEEEEP